MIENPFITYGYESADYFCDRKAEPQEFTTLLTNGNHTVLISPRRMGKTGLIHHCFAQKEIQDRYYTFLIDIYATKNLQDMVYRMGQSIVNRLKSRGQSAIDGFLRFVTSLRTGISFDGQGKLVQAIMEKQLLTHQQGVYEVYDKFMAEWLSAE